MKGVEPMGTLLSLLALSSPFSFPLASPLMMSVEKTLPAGNCKSSRAGHFLSERFSRVTTQINLPCIEISQSLRTELHFWFEKRSEDRKREREIVEAEAEERKHERGEENRRE